MERYNSIPMLPVRDVVVFPYMILPLFVGRESSIKAVEEADAGNKLVFLAAQKNVLDEAPSAEGIYTVGTVATIIRVKKLPDGRIKMLVQGINRAVVKSYDQTEPFMKVTIESIDEQALATGMEADALVRNVKEQLEKIVSSGKLLTPDLLLIIEEIKETGKLADLCLLYTSDAADE